MKDLKSGNSTFGVELWVIAAATNDEGYSTLQSALSAQSFAHNACKDLPQGPSASYLEALGDVGVSATVFGYNQPIVELNAYIESNDGFSDEADFYALGTKVYTTGTTGVANWSVSKTFFEESEEFEILGIPISVDADVTGQIGAGVNVYGDAANPADFDTLTGVVTPSAGLDLGTSVGVGVTGFGAGVEGTLNLVTFSIPVTDSLTLSSEQYTSNVQFDVSSLAGTVDLYADAGPFKATKKIASFSGYTTSMTLLDRKVRRSAARRGPCGHRACPDRAASRPPPPPSSSWSLPCPVVPLYLVGPVLLAAALAGVKLWPGSAPAALPSASLHAPLAAPASALGWLHLTPASATRARYRLVADQRAVVEGKEVVAVTVAGTWITTEREAGRTEVELREARITAVGDETAQPADVAAPFLVVRREGALHELAFPATMKGQAKDLLGSLATALQVTPREGDAWTVEEEDLTGRYEARYTRSGDRLTRTRGPYTAARASTPGRASRPGRKTHASPSRGGRAPPSTPAGSRPRR